MNTRRIRCWPLLALAVSAWTHAAEPQTAAPEAAEKSRATRQSLIIEGGAKVGAANRQPKAGPYNVIAAMKTGRCEPSGGAELMASLPYPPMSSPDGSIEMFSLPPLVRYLYESGNCMSAQDKDRLLQGLTRKQRLTDHGTLNHAAMKMTSWYLLAQYFPDARWTDWDGKTYTSPQLMADLKSRMSRRNWRMFASGQYELLSPTYSIVNLFPYLNLFDFAKDPEVKAIANAEATLEVMTMQAHSFQGSLVPPLMRRNNDQHNAPLPGGSDMRTSVGQHVLWFYFGQPTTDDKDLRQGGEPMYASILALSDWRPPKAAMLWPEVAKGGYTIRFNTPEFAILDADTYPTAYGDSYIGKRFALGTANMVFNPAGYNKDNQGWSLLYESDGTRNQIECYHPYWRGNAGEDAWNSDRWSAFQETYRYDDGSAVILYNIPDKDPYVYAKDGKDYAFFQDRENRKDALFKVVNCRVPRSVDEVVTEDQWVFARKGKVYMALGTLNGSNEYAKPSSSGPLADYLSFKVREASTGLYVRAVDATGGGSFADFIKETKNLKPRFDPKTVTATWRNKAGAAVKMQFVLKPDTRPGQVAALPEVTVDGKLLPRPPAQPVLQSPWMTLSDGVLNVSVPGANFSMRAPRRD